MSNQTANTQTTNFLPVQATYEPLYPYDIITFIGPAGLPFYAPVNPNLDGVNITNSTINSTTIGATTPSTAAFTTATMSNQPVGNLDLCNKTYVDAAIVGISWKQPVRAATTISITLSGAQTIDNVSVVAGDRVLVKDQSSAAENGIYIVGTPWTRSPDANTWDELVSAMVFVESGGQAGNAFYCPIQPGGTLGVTAVNWSNFSVAGTYFAGTGLSLAANTFSITNTGVSAATYGSASTVPAIAVNAQGQITSATNTSIAINANQITSGTVDSARISGNYTGITGVGTLTNLTVTNTISGSINGNAATATSATSATTATNLAGGATGSLPYQSATGTTAMLAAGTNGQFLTLSSGVPAWTNAPSSALTISADTANATRYPVFNDAATGSASTLYTTSAKYTFNPSTGTLTTSAHYLDYLDFNTGATVTPAVGRMWWGTTGTANFRIDSGAGYDTQINEQIFVYGKASSAITKGNLVIKTGVVGASGVITFAPSTAGITDGNLFVGVAYEDIALNGFGRVVAVGLVRGINTSAYSNNDTLWYDPAGGGAMTATKPSAPNVKAEIGIVINAGSGSSGSIYVKIFPGSQLGGTDQNVQLTTPISNNSLLQYDSALTYWKNVAASSVSVGTATNLAGGATGSLPYQSGAGATTFLAAGSDGQVLKLASGVPTWSSDASGVTIVDDTTTNATRYLTFVSATSGNVTTENVSSTKLQFNPSSGLFIVNGVAVGTGAGSVATNTALGASALAANTTGANNVAVGYQALDVNTTGANNTAVGSAALGANTTGANNTAVGYGALDANTTGIQNTVLGVDAGGDSNSSYLTAIGYQAGKANADTTNGSVMVGWKAGATNTTGAIVAIGVGTLFNNTTGVGNTAVGNSALNANTTASNNTAIGDSALKANTTGANNTAVGVGALDANTTGVQNIGIGTDALGANTTGNYNTAVGYVSMLLNTTGSSNTAFGRAALRGNTTADNNTAIGYEAMYDTTTGGNNTALGVRALTANTTGADSVAIGYQALDANTTGTQNVAVGRDALGANTFGDRNTAVGYQALNSCTTGRDNVAVGYLALQNLTTGLANAAFAVMNSSGATAPVFNVTTENNRIVMGHTGVTNAYVQVAWTVTSDARDKTNISPVPHGLSFVNQLNPVSFQFKTSRDDDTPNGNKRYGFLAQDILALEGDDPVIIDTEVPEKLKYQGESLVPVLVKAVQELSAKCDALQAEVNQLKGQ